MIAINEQLQKDINKYIKQSALENQLSLIIFANIQKQLCLLKSSKLNAAHSNYQKMEDHLQFIEEFALTIANTFKQFAQACRDSLKKAKDPKPDYTQLQQQLIKERKRRMELEDIVRQKISGGVATGEQISIQNKDQRKIPKTAFSLFLADQREKIVKQHPSLNFNKIIALAAIKWKKLSDNDKQSYNRKFQELKKLYEQQEDKQKNGKDGTHNNETSYVKKQFNQEEAREEPPADYQPQNQRMQQNDGNQQIEKGQIHHNEGEAGEQFMPTMRIENEDNQPTLPIQFPPTEKGNIQKILDLFHTSNQEQQQLQKSEQREQAEEAVIEKQDGDKHANEEETDEKVQLISVDPSLMIIESPNVGSENIPIVIAPTVQSQPEDEQK